MNAEQDEMLENPRDLTGVQKAAVFLISFGVEKASKVLKELRDPEVEKVTKAISELKNVSPDVVDSVMDEFYELMADRKFLIEGGQDIARNLLEQTKGKNQADEMFKKFEAERGEDAFTIIQNSEVQNIVHFLQNEHPQIAAVILAHLKLNKTAEIMTHLSPEFRGDVALRMARLGKISGEIVEELSHVIKDQLSSEYTDRNNIHKGASAVAGILNESDIATERSVLESIEAVDPDLAKEIKDQMFLFEDILDLDDRTMQAIVAKLDKQDMVTGLKGVDEKIKEKFLSNMSTRAKDILVDDLEALGPVHVKKVEEAQQNIVKSIKQMDQEGKISIRNKEADQIIE
ncbi:MAG: flagellar motor switch protein FliG [Balneolaceae bacterium]